MHLVRPACRHFQRAGRSIEEPSVQNANGRPEGRPCAYCASGRSSLLEQREDRRRGLVGLGEHRLAGRPPLLVSEAQIRHGLSQTVATDDPALRAWIDQRIALDKAAFGAKHGLDVAGAAR